MAASSGDDIPAQLAALLGNKKVTQIRKTNENPPRISIIDVVATINQKDKKNQAAEDLRRLSTTYPDVKSCFDFKFPGRGQKNTPVTDAKGIIEIIMLLTTKQAARVRRDAAELLCRYLGGDLTLVDEVCRIHGFQEQLAAESPDDARRIFGDDVEATGGGIMTNELSRACNQAIANAVPEILERLSAHIDEYLAQNRQHVNSPLPLARFLDEKEIADPSWCGVRKSLVPSFGIQMQILKKRKLHEEGAEAVYVEQNHRAQLLYTENDRELMEEAWQLMSAHREDLVSRWAVPAAPAMPRVRAMLQGGA